MEGEPTIAAKAKLSFAILDNEIVEPRYKIQCILPIFLEGYSKVDNDNGWWKYCERNSQLENKRRRAFSVIQVQCMQALV